MTLWLLLFGRLLVSWGDSFNLFSSLTNSLQSICCIKNTVAADIAWQAGSSWSVKPWGNERQKNKNLGVSVLAHESLVFGSVFTSSIPNMEGKLLPRTDTSKTLSGKILFNENRGWFWALLYGIIIVFVPDKVRNYVEIYLYLYLVEKNRY